MKDNEIIKSLEKIYSESVDTHSIYTPLDLCEEMINSISKLEGDILVISNLEFLITLKRNGVDMNTVHYSVNCHLKKQVAITLGVNSNNIYELDYNKKEINLGTEDMKFDVIIQNPPYNPNSLWKKFVLMGIDQLKDDGQMVVIHPDSWRKKTSHKKFFNYLKEHISELHISGFNAFPGIKISTDWYVYNKEKQSEMLINYENDENEILISKNIDHIFKFSQNSIPANIINKISKTGHDNGIIMLKGWDEYKNPQIENGKYKQCGGIGNGTGWTKGDFIVTNKPTKHQFENKIVMSYTRKPRAKYFSKEDEIGVLKAYYWLTDNQSLPILLNSKMLWKLFIETEGEENLNAHPIWLLRSLNFDGLNVKTEEELYEHYGLTEEEIEWIENN